MGSFTPDTELPHINLQLGWPTPSLFAREQLLKGSQSVLSSPSDTAIALVYGPHPGYLVSAIILQISEILLTESSYLASTQRGCEMA
jgi:DNA-binding transcriptional MocR family regulator